MCGVLGCVQAGLGGADESALHPGHSCQGRACVSGEQRKARASEQTHTELTLVGQLTGRGTRDSYPSFCLFIGEMRLKEICTSRVVLGVGKEQESMHISY